MLMFIIGVLTGLFIGLAIAVNYVCGRPVDLSKLPPPAPGTQVKGVPHPE